MSAGGRAGGSAALVEHSFFGMLGCAGADASGVDDPLPGSLLPRRARIRARAGDVRPASEYCSTSFGSARIPAGSGQGDKYRQPSARVPVADALRALVQLPRLRRRRGYEEGREDAQRRGRPARAIYMYFASPPTPNLGAGSRAPGRAGQAVGRGRGPPARRAWARRLAPRAACGEQEQCETAEDQQQDRQRGGTRRVDRIPRSSGLLPRPGAAFRGRLGEARPPTGPSRACPARVGQRSEDVFLGVRSSRARRPAAERITSLVAVLPGEDLADTAVPVPVRDHLVGAGLRLGARRLGRPRGRRGDDCEHQRDDGEGGRKRRLARACGRTSRGSLPARRGSAIREG